MEHIPLPKGANLDEDDNVRYVALTYDGDGSDFLTYGPGQIILEPIRGFIKAEYLGEHIQELEQILQTWLCIVLLKATVGDRLDYDKMKREEGGRMLLDTGQIPKIVDDWMSTIPLTQQIADDFTRYFRLVNHLMMCTMGSQFDDNIKFSIGSVATLLNKTVDDRFRELPGAYTSIGFGPAVYWSSNRINRMVSKDWCRYEANILPLVNASLLVLFFMSKLAPINVDRQHTECSESDCLASKVQFDRQRGALHLTRNCKCGEEIAIDEREYEHMIDILLSGDYPILQINHGVGGNTFALKYIARKLVKTYTAISHVWSDGLGNRLGNALYPCRLLHLYKQVLNAFGSGTDGAVYIWLDTYCIPHKGKEDLPYDTVQRIKDARATAFKTMADVYSNAQQALILDAGLEQTVTTGLSTIEIAARVLSSRWITRLWTLQEGALPPRGSIQFSDQVLATFGVTGLGTELYNQGQTGPLVSRTLAYSLNARLTFIRGYRQVERQDLFSTVSGALKWRLTTSKEDEPLCLATLIGLNAGSMSRFGTHESRMADFWKQASDESLIPKSTVFHSGPKLSTEGFRWAPSTLRIKRNDSVLVNDPPGIGVVLPRGLRVELPGCFISAPQPPAGFDTSLWRENDQFSRATPIKPGNLNVRLGQPRSDQPQWGQLSTLRSGDEGHVLRDGNAPFEYDVLHDPGKRFAIILSLGTGTSLDHALTSERWGLLVETIGDTNDSTNIIFAKKICKVTLKRCTPKLSTIYEEGRKYARIWREKEQVQRITELTRAPNGERDVAAITLAYRQLEREIPHRSLLQGVMGRYGEIDVESFGDHVWCVD